MLMRDDKVIFDLTLPESSEGLEGTLRPCAVAEREMERLCAFYSMGSNRKRLRVMTELARGGELRFSDVMQIATNPKLAQDCLQPMLREGLVVHGERGSGYRIPEKALPLMMTLTVGLARMLSVLDEELTSDEGGALR